MGETKLTLLVSWLGVDSRGASSAYIATDSRISWGNGANFDFGKKVFAFANHPDILGYCGDVLFPSIVLSQIVEMGDCGLLFREEHTPKRKFQIIAEKITTIFKKYPSEFEHIMTGNMQIIHLSRNQNNNKEFFCHTIEWDRNKGWKGRNVLLPDESNILFCLGSGSTEFKKNYMDYQEGINKNTSRNIFHCFCDTLFNISDPFCGGAPQLIGLYRKPFSNAIKYGIINNNKRYLFGAEVNGLSNYNEIEWRNTFFELCDGNTMKRKENAMIQPDLMRRNR